MTRAGQGDARTALYRLYDANGQLLYVGITDDPDDRWSRHAASKSWWPLVDRKDLTWLHGTWAEALQVEAEAIRAERPVFNGRHNYPEAPFFADEWPKIGGRRGKAQALADLMRAEIRSGRWATGMRIPTRGQLAAATGISKSAAAGAYRMLQDEDLIWCLSGLGSFVSNGRTIFRPNHQRPEGLGLDAPPVPSPLVVTAR